MRGVGAMLHELSGGSKKNASDYYGKKIKKAELNADDFLIEFEDGTRIKISDNGQSCCEHRYLTCDDDLNSLEGNTLKGITVKYSDADSGDDDAHEIAFLEIQTDKNSVTFACHNEHNGYYGGFGLSVDEV